MEPDEAAAPEIPGCYNPVWVFRGGDHSLLPGEDRVHQVV